MKKKSILILSIITLLMNSIVTIPINSIAAVEDGDFIKEELPYDISFKEISIGKNHSLAIDEDGNLWAWGYNNDGQLGTENTNFSVCPIQIKKGIKFSKVAAGEKHSLAIDEDGRLWGWGDNSYGQLKTKKVSYDIEKIYTPEILTHSNDFVQVSAASTYSIAIDINGYLWEWGNNIRASSRYDEPTKISNEKFIKISSNANHSLAIDKNGYLWTWGYNGYGQLGNASQEISTMPQNIKGGTKFVEISAGYFHSLAIDNNGNLWTWGNNEYGQLGNESEINSMIPVKIMRGKKISKISAGRNHSMAIDEEGKLWMWGYNKYGQLGNETTVLSNIPIQIKSDTEFNEIFAGNSNSMAIDKNGLLWAWGYNEYGQLGNGEKSAFSEKFVNIHEEMRFKQISAGRTHALAIDNEDNLWAWGENKYGLGDGTTTKSRAPIQIKNGTKFKQISSVGNYSMAIDTQNNLWAWGYNAEGQLGDGSEENKNTPVQIKSGTKFERVATGYNHSLAIDNDGNLWAWGYNYYGQLGDGSEENKNTPVQITNETKFKEISVGSSYSLAIDSEGNIWSWGENQWGQLGNGTATSINKINKPTKIDSSAKFTKIIAGSSYTSMAIDEDGNLWAWGDYIVESSKPKQLTYTSNFTQIAITPGSMYWDNIHYSKIDTNGNLYIWGENEYGQLGNGTTIDNSTPSKVKSNCKMVANSDAATYVIDNDGKLFVCGENKYGLVDTSYYKSPIQITGKIKQFTVTFKDGTEREETQTVNSGEPATAPNWTKPGYDLSWSEDITNITSDLEVEAIWTARENTPYTVEHHLQNLNKTEYVKDDTATESKEGTTNTQTNAVAKNYTGFTAQPFEQKTIRGEGDTVVIIYYNRNTYTITLNPGEGTLPAGSEEIEYTYGEEKELPVPTRPGYNFEGWYDEEGNKVEKITPTDSGNKELEANWTPKTDTPYKVIHHFRNLDLESEGFIDEEEAKTGTTGTTATAEYKTLEGFTKNEADTRTIKQGTIAGDGSLVLHLYYTRNTYNIEYELNGGTINGSLTNKYVYGKETFLQNNRVSKQGYTFAGWYDNEELTGSPVTSIPNTSTGDKTFYAKWIDVEQEYYILSEVYSINLTENTITKVRPQTTMETFLNNIDTNGQKKLLNLKGEEVAKQDLVGTGYKLQVTFKGEVHTYEIAVRGDLDGNGKITTTDLSIINQQILHKIELTGIKKKAADTNYDGKLTTTDLSMINQAVLRKITL